MTTTVAPATPAAPPGPAGAAGTAGAPHPTAGWRSTPGGLRLRGALAAVLTAAMGLLGVLLVSSQSLATDAARGAATQLVGLQDARNQLVAADAAATTAFLVGGLEPVGLRERYDAAVDAGARALTVLASTGPDGAAGLGGVSADLTRYTGLVEQARANNRQGFPVASAYLEEASTVLREQIVPALDELVAAEQRQVDAQVATARFAAPTLVGAGVLVLVLLVVVQVWVARRTRRRLNAGLAAATVAVVLVAAVGGAVLGGAATRAVDVRDDAYRATVQTSQAFALVNDARSREAFTLIRRGSGATYEEEFRAAVADARTALDRDGVRLDPTLVGRLDAWVAAHDEVRALDDAGDWDAAVELVTSDAGTAPPALFDDLSAGLADAVETGAARVTDELRPPPALLGWVLAALGGAGAVLAWTGLRARREEYR